MKETEQILTIKETEQLCRLYMECKLSLLEESELLYILTTLPYSTPLIDEVKVIMGVQIKDIKPISKISTKKKWWNKSGLYQIAASISIFVLSIAFVSNYDTTIKEDSNFSIAYANGIRVSQDEAEILTEADMKKADAFMARIAELENQEQNKLNSFNTLNSKKQ